MVVMLFFLILKCGHSIKVGYDYNLQEDFLSFKTYDFMKSPASAQVREYVLKRLKESINRELSQKGMKQSSINPDILIAIHPLTDNRLNISNWGYIYAPYSAYWGQYVYWMSSRVDRYEYQKGTLIIDFIRSDNKELVWRGVAESALPDSPRSDQIDKVVNKAVSEIMKKYPPPVQQE